MARIGQPGDAIVELTRGRELCVEMGDRGREAHALFLMCWCAIDLGDLDRADRWLHDGLRLARQVGLRAHEAVGQRLRGLLRLEQGRRVEARALLEEAAQVLLDVGFPAEAAVALHGLALVHLVDDEPEEAVDALDRALSLQVSAPWLAVQATGLLGLVHGLLGDIAGARRALAAWRARVNAHDLREVDLIEPCVLAVESLDPAGAPVDLRPRIIACLERPAVALEGRVVRSILRRVATP